MLYWAGLKPTTSVVIGIDCKGSCKSNYHMITPIMAPNHMLDLWETEQVITLFKFIGVFFIIISDLCQIEITMCKCTDFFSVGFETNWEKKIIVHKWISSLYLWKTEKELVKPAYLHTVNVRAYHSLSGVFIYTINILPARGDNAGGWYDMICTMC